MDSSPGETAFSPSLAERPVNDARPSSKRTTNPRKMKGVGFEVEEMMKLFLVIIIGLGVVILIIAASGGISSLLAEFCAKNPGICGTTGSNTKDYETAQNSVKALVCAINSVAKGKDLCGTASFSGEESLTNDFGFTAFAINNYNSMPGVKCGAKNAETELVNAKSVRIPAGETPDPAKYFGCVPDTPEPTMGPQATKLAQICYTCEEGELIETTKQCKIVLKSAFTCTVSNFQLPQKVSEKWIWTYGDPQFITYWQVFPIEADTWSFKVDWKIHVAIALVTILPPTKVAAGFSKVAAEKIVGSITAREAETTLTNELISIAKQRIEKEKLRAITKLGVLEGAALATEYAASTRAKFYPDRNSFIMKSPFEKKEIFNLVSEIEGKPVFLEWSTNDIIGGGAVDTAHFVSPCNIQSMDVEKAKVTCNEYFVNSKTGIIQCAKFASIEKATDDKSGWWYTAKKYINNIFSSAQEPSCDINYYIDVYEPYINDMEYIKDMTSQDLAKSLFNNNIPQPKSCDEGNTEATVILNGKSYVIAGCYKNSPTKFDKIEIKDGDKVETLLDTDFDGSFDSYMLKGCRTDAIIVSNVKKASINDDYNYCFDQTARFMSWGQASTYGAAIGTAIVFAIVFPPSSIVSGLAAIGSIFAVQQGTYEAITEFDKARDRWPGRTGG